MPYVNNKFYFFNNLVLLNNYISESSLDYSYFEGTVTTQRSSFRINEYPLVELYLDIIFQFYHNEKTIFYVKLIIFPLKMVSIYMRPFLN